jgi:hypothetical protein
MADDPDIPDFKPVDQHWQMEYGRLRKLGNGNYWEGCRLEEAAAEASLLATPAMQPARPGSETVVAFNRRWKGGIRAQMGPLIF